MPSFSHLIGAVRKSGQCSLIAANNEDKYTCFSMDALRILARTYNMRHPSKAIAFGSMSKRAIWNALHEAFLERGCGEDETCWVRELGAEHVANVKRWLKPSKPTNMSWANFCEMWLTTEQIRDVMHQYQHIFRSNFMFLGVSPINFQESYESGECVGRLTCDFSVSRLLSAGKTRFGLIANTDKAEEPGEHWVSLYCNMDPNSKNYGIYYYDSNGCLDKREIPIQIRKFKAIVKEQMEDLGHPSFPTEYNKRRQQRKDGQCGMFAICFIVAMLCDEDFHQYCSSKAITDALMKQLRCSFFA